MVDRAPYLWLLHAGSVLVVILCLLGCLHVLRTRGRVACWWLGGPAIVTFGASMLGLFPIAPRLTLFLLPGLILLFVAGLSQVLRRGRAPVTTPGLTAAAVVLVLPLACLSVLRVFSLEPSRHFQRLVTELRERRRPGEPVYIFARSLPAWIYYSTDWAHPDTARLRFLIGKAGSEGGAFENARSRGLVRPEEARALDSSAAAPGELLGLPSGMEWREVQEHVRAEPDSGWVEVERRRIEAAAAPGVWVLASAYYARERELFAALERDATRRTFAHLRPGSALVRYEFGRAASSRESSAPVNRPVPLVRLVGSPEDDHERRQVDQDQQHPPLVRGADRPGPLRSELKQQVGQHREGRERRGLGPIPAHQREGSVSYTAVVPGTRPRQASSRPSGRRQRSRPRSSRKPPGRKRCGSWGVRATESSHSRTHPGRTRKLTATNSRPPIRALRLGYAAQSAKPTVGLTARIQEREGVSAAAIRRGGHWTSTQLHSIAPLMRK